ncbi:MAG: GntR family transcriptional regulator [Pigmentiphaga sp.]
MPDSPVDPITFDAGSSSRSGVPLYMLVAETLIRDIQSGRYPVGNLLPAEREIGQRFGVSRHTTREAIRRLEEMGLITRRAGIGTTVKSRLAHTRYTASISDLTELVHYAEKTRLQVLDEDWVSITGDLADIVHDAQGQRWLKITALRFPEDQQIPISYTETLVPATFQAFRDGIRNPLATVFKLIEGIRGERVAEVRQDITCRPLPRQHAEALGVAPGSPSLYVLRYYYGRNDDLLSVSVNFYPQDRFKISTRWRLDPGFEP